MSIQIDDTQPPLSTEQTLTGWRREFCVQLLGEGQARIFLRAVEAPSQRAAELQQAILFLRVGAAFADLRACVAAAQGPLEQLVRSATRLQPSQDNLFATLSYDRQAWDRVKDAVEGWQRGARPPLPR